MVERIGVSVAFVLVALCLAATVARAASGPLKTPAKPHPANTQSDVASDVAQPRQTKTRHRSPGRPPPESGRPAIGPRTTQGLAADAVSRSSGR